MGSKRGGIAVLLAAAVVTAVAVAGPAGAGPRGKKNAAAYGTSCIDGNNNGVCGESADTPLANALQDGSYNDSQHGSHSGLVIQGGVARAMPMRWR